jgi:hypothetical protein
MFSPAKAITAAAIAVGIGSAVFIAQPFGREGDSLPAAATDEERAAPTEFTGHIVCGPEVRTGTSEWLRDAAGGITGARQQRGFAWQPTTTEMSDTRLAGDYYQSYDSDRYASGVSVGSGIWRIENKEGAWQGSFPLIIQFPDYATTVTTSLVGSGAYEGLTAIWEAVHHPDRCDWDVRGVIIEGEPPAVPEPFVAE